MGFFLNLFGFPEQSYAETQQSLIEIASFTPVPSTTGYFREHCEFSLSDGSTVSAGIFSMPSVTNLRDAVQKAVLEICPDAKKKMACTTLQNIIGEARALHSDSAIVDNGAVIQAASQFNFLEFPSPRFTPEAGIEDYEFDPTQGPACATACGAGTAYRNYLVPMSFQQEEEIKRGQTKQDQLNGLESAEIFLSSELGEMPWTVSNGYIESSRLKLKRVNQMIKGRPELREKIISLISIGVHEDTAVTDHRSQGRIVTQTYNSAISIGYSRLPLSVWEPVATAVLDATYEATLLVGVLKTIECIKNGRTRPVILLTKVGGGVFQNKDSWIRQSIKRSLDRLKLLGVGLDIRIVHFGRIQEDYSNLEE
mmetsp:Transcript_24434/g.36918  ORF Transcript_24434/g.36918 Transcript_24434/m.36918 type:complete len:367 (-) Transcript_24434:204-1304(-)